MNGPPDKNRRVVMILLGVVVAMGAGAWAAVPFYDWFCRTTGFAGTVFSLGWGLFWYAVSLGISGWLLRRRIPEVVGWVQVY